VTDPFATRRTLAAAMQREVRYMQRVDPLGRGVRTVVAVLAASALLTAGFGGSGHSAGTTPAVAYVCPPAC